MEAAMWEKVAQIDKEKEAICNENGIETVKPSKELMSALSDVTEGIRRDWLEGASDDAKALYSEFMKKVDR
jgi:hypothetical protein